MKCPNCNSSGMHAVPPSDKEHERISHECRACGYQEHKTKELADAYLVRCEGCGTHRLRVPELGTGARCSIHPDAKQIALNPKTFQPLSGRDAMAAMLVGQ